MADPYGITQVNVPGLLQMYEGVKRTRLDDMYRQKQVERQDVAWKREDEEHKDKQEIKKAYSDAFTPVSNPVNVEDPNAAITASTFRPGASRLNALRATGPEGFKAASEIEKMGAEQLKAAQEAVTRMLDIKGRVISGVRALPPERREQAYMAERANLIANGAKPGSLPAAWDEAMADSMIRQGLTAAQALGLDQQAKEFAYRVKHDGQTLAVSQGNLDVARGNLTARREAIGAVKGGLVNTPTKEILMNLGLGN